MLIEIEGPRGAGKSTLIEKLGADAHNSQPPFIDSRALEQCNSDPGWLVGELMRGLGQPLPPREAVFLYCARTAARVRVISELVAPGSMVLSDRLRLSLYVQARLAGIAATDARTLMRLALHGVEPDCTVLLDTDYTSHHQRLAEQGREAQPEPEFQATRDHFAHAYRQVTGPKLCINTASMTLQGVQAAVLGWLPLSRRAP
jgi:dTMP kinase